MKVMSRSGNKIHVISVHAYLWLVHFVEMSTIISVYTSYSYHLHTFSHHFHMEKQGNDCIIVSYENRGKELQKKSLQ